jgi:ATP-dependent Clp protease ATP-binding subunit ClpA
VGPTGVGKNHLVESLQRSLGSLWDLEIPMLTIEGPNYTYPSDINELRGATRGFVRSDEEGILTRFHEQSSRSPVAIILIDEVEKAHSQLITFFLSILDRGTTTDNRGDVLNFSNCLIFFTSNLGYSDQQQDASMVGFVDREQRAAIASSDIRRELRRALKPEFVNRVRLLHFDRLTVESAEHILDLEFGKIARRYEQMHEIRLKLEDSARQELVRRGFSSAYGARRLAATLESICNVEIAKKIRSEDRSNDEDRSRLIQWIREVRDGSRHYDVDEVRRRVTELARLKPGYSELSIRFEGDEFHYDPGQAE